LVTKGRERKYGKEEELHLRGKIKDNRKIDRKRENQETSKRFD